MIRIVAFSALALLAGFALHAFAQRVDVRPAVTPIGSSSSNGVSFAWFYDAPSRTVYVCRGGLPSSTPECSASSRLP